MPSDITGTEVIQEDRTTGEREFKFINGPIFANVILADEINRTPPKTQAALLEAMQERQVTAGGEHVAAGAVLRARHPEPDRAGGHLPAARGAARPVHVQGLRRLPGRGRGVRRGAS
jgi:MoxR-like ATPase